MALCWFFDISKALKTTEQQIFHALSSWDFPLRASAFIKHPRGAAAQWFPKSGNYDSWLSNRKPSTSGRNDRHVRGLGFLTASKSNYCNYGGLPGLLGVGSKYSCYSVTDNLVTVRCVINRCYLLLANTNDHHRLLLWPMRMRWLHNGA